MKKEKENKIQNEKEKLEKMRERIEKEQMRREEKILEAQRLVRELQEKEMMELESKIKEKKDDEVDDEQNWDDWKQEQDRLYQEAQERLRKARELKKNLKTNVDNQNNVDQNKLTLDKQNNTTSNQNNSTSNQNNSTSNETSITSISRDTIVYTLDENFDQLKFLEEIEKETVEDFYELTQEDLQLNAKIEKKKKIEQDRNKQVFKTRDIREKERLKKFSKYKRVYIRIKFPDNIILQACFHPQETPTVLYTFVKECLEDQNMDFYLYITPPRVVLKKTDDTFFRDLGFLPAALVYFGCTTESQSPLLKQNLLEIKKKEEVPRYKTIEEEEKVEKKWILIICLD